MKLSVIIPIHNERENVGLLHRELTTVMRGMQRGQINDYEIIFVDDGSTDGSLGMLRRFSEEDPQIRVVAFRRNYGQTAAMQAGFEHASGNVIVTMDGDLQNDPADIPRMLDRLRAGYDLVHGWRRDRQDAWLSRTLPSKLANRLISATTRFPIHDLGCTLKVIRREIVDDLELYGQMHRFIPILAAERGARCSEVVTHHRARQFGTSNYGISRTVQVLLDLVTVKYMVKYFANPMRLFGKLAAICFAIGACSFLGTALMKWQAGTDMTGNPLLMLGVFCWLTSTQLVSLGLLGEVSARLYYQRDGHRPFTVAGRYGFETSPSEPTSDRSRSMSPAFAA